MASVVLLAVVLFVVVGALLILFLVSGGEVLDRPVARPAEIPSRPPSLAHWLPWPGEIWWAMVPFDDGSGAKDRPCLVLFVQDEYAEVAKITSKYNPRVPAVIELPPGSVNDRQERVSYVQARERRHVHVSAFRRRVGPVDPGVWSRLR
ncbi:type II toxin-antitoxin system PemK/MazF family toxin [Streptomyces sp. CA-288835]|uniref:type II toxin-antitoxin system PemK/MazF family toxin n=1 Tax=Streptomyces sp. CA-288835 TaxID=3240069 RepID=UPI003D8E5A5D